MSRFHLCLLPTWCWLLGSAGVFAAERLPSAMESDPAFPPRTTIHTAPDRLLPLWLEAITQEDVEAEVVAQVAKGLVRMRRLGIAVEEPIGGQIADRLASHLQRAGLDNAAKLAVAHALVDFDASKFAAQLAAQLPHGGRDMAEIVEPALARWGDTTLRDQWLARLRDPRTPPQLQRLAIRALGSLKASASREALLQLAADSRQSPAIRIAAAESLAASCEGGLESHARRLLSTDGGSQPLSQLVAAYMLRRHSGQQTEELLVQLADAKDPAVAATAVKQLMNLNPALVQPLRDRLLGSADPELRRLGVRVLKQNPEADGTQLLGNLLADGHVGVRRAAGAALIELASQPARHHEICNLVTSHLGVAAPLQTEESLRVLAALDAEEAAPRILELLDADHPTVSVTAAWALERLAKPEMAEQIFLQAVHDTDSTVDAVKILAPLYEQQATPDVELPNLDAEYARLEHLIVTLGQLRYAKAEELLRRFVPKPSWEAGDPPPLEAFHQPRPRAAAIWSLGKIYAGRGDQAPAALLDALADRMSDATPIPREEPLVRSMAAISLGRIGASRSLAPLRESYASGVAHDDLGRACGWALEQMIGQAPAPLEARNVRHVDWFLVPIE